MTIEFSTNGSTWVDITDLIAWQGLTFSLNSVDAPDAGRDMSGLMHRGMVAIKEKMNIQTVQLTRAQVAGLFVYFQLDAFYVRVTPYPNTNASKILHVYTNNVKTTYVIHRQSGEDLQSLSFPLIEL